MNESKYEYEENESNGYETEQYDIEEESVHNTTHKSYHSSNHKLVNIILCVSLALCGIGEVAYKFYESNKPEETTVEVISTERSLKTFLAKAEIYINEGNYEQAINQYLQAIELDPNNKSLYIKVADLYYAREDFETEANFLKDAMSKFSDNIFYKKYNVVTAIDRIINNSDVKRSGKFGSLYWCVDNNGLLEVAGDGDYAPKTSTPKWLDYNYGKYNSDIKSAKFTVINITKCTGLLKNCRNLESVDLSELDTSSVTDMSSMFKGCTSLTYIDLSTLDFSSVIKINSMFDGCINLSTIEYGIFNTKIANNMSCMFRNCKSLVSIDLSTFNTTNVKSMNNMFDGCSNLESIGPSDYIFTPANNHEDIFEGCDKLDYSNINIIIK